MHSLEVNSWNLIVFQFKRINWKRWVIYVSPTICWARVGSQNMLSFFFFWWLIFIRWLSYIPVSTEEASAMPVLNGVVNRVRNVFKFRLFGKVETLYTYACFLATKRQPWKSIEQTRCLFYKLGPSSFYGMSCISYLENDWWHLRRLL